MRSVPHPHPDATHYVAPTIDQPLARCGSSLSLRDRLLVGASRLADAAAQQDAATAEVVLLGAIQDLSRRRAVALGELLGEVTP
jgi:hypothetical protein